MNILRYSIIFCFAVLTLVTCQDSDEMKEVPSERLGRRILIYMVADNNLDYFAIRNINEMEEGLFYTKNPIGEIWIYIDRGEQGSPSHPYLMKLKADTTTTVASRIFRTYPEQNSASPKVLKEVLDDVRKLSSKSVEKEGLVLWSHGNAWLPQSVSLYSDRDKLLSGTKTIQKTGKKEKSSFGIDDVTIAGELTGSPKEMDIKELANTLKDEYFEFILFDACFMGAIEVVYELKDSANYIIASPTEILSFGFPYRYIIPTLLTENSSLIDVAKQKREFYTKLKGALKSSSVTVVDTKILPVLSEFLKEYFVKKLGFIDITEKGKLYSLKHLQQFDRLGADYLFDMKSFIEKVYTDRKENEEKHKFINLWRKVVSYESHTPYFMGALELKECGGLSMYILQNKPKRKKTNEYYKTLKWYKDTRQ